MSNPIPQGFAWRESPHQGDLFKINPHRKVYTYYYEDFPIARIEPAGRGLVAHFVAEGLESPGRPVAVPTVPRGKAFVQNWVRQRQLDAIVLCRYAQIAHDVNYQTADVRLTAN